VNQSAGLPASVIDLARSPVSSRAVRDALDRVLRSPGFANAPSLCRFLARLVEHGLGGQPEGLKEFTIGVEVFGRTDAFDPRTDTFVRVKARRVRAKVAGYYGNEGWADEVVFFLA
jgi:hypothetical protein